MSPSERFELFSLPLDHGGAPIELQHRQQSRGPPVKFDRKSDSRLAGRTAQIVPYVIALCQDRSFSVWFTRLIS